MVHKVLIANRGEIALRVIRTCREMGIETVAVYSEADTHAAHRLAADQAICIGPSEPAQSYLNMDAIIRAATMTGADAIHPGYGFLSENAAFARKCGQAGLLFIGPPAQVIHNMGDKLTARHIMEAGGVPVVPGISGSSDSHEELIRKADALGYPVMIKASAGGGGKGIRIVHSKEEMVHALQTASSEALRAFGNGQVYLEKFFPRARHVEFQILADTRGHTIHLMERECSVQRRYQKIIEETPSPALNPELRDQMGRAAVAAAKAAGYVNAGTVEFLLDDQGQFYFLEMNTRIQVEHPITELTTGIDIVAWQIRIAAGDPLPWRQEDILARGHAIECRIYAENPENHFFPSPGTIAVFEPPSGPGIRIDTGVYSGASVPVEYDPILSKLCVWAENRNQAMEKMIQALTDFVVVGVHTGIPFLKDVLNCPEFRQGQVFTNFIDNHFSQWQPDAHSMVLAGLAYIADETTRLPEANPVQSSHQISGPFQNLGHWRL